MLCAHSHALYLPPLISSPRTTPPTGEVDAEVNKLDVPSMMRPEKYGYECFETFKHKVASLCAALWPCLSPEQIVIERMNGCSYNRIIGINAGGASDDLHFLARVQ
jgi:hypothetical protein